MVAKCMSMWALRVDYWLRWLTLAAALHPSRNRKLPKNGPLLPFFSWMVFPASLALRLVGADDPI